MKKRGQAAQNQHYVPKFILRQFLAERDGERVSVFQKKNQRGFVTSIANVMAERRFHEFSIGDDYIASFEQSVGKIEDAVLPVYREVLESRRLSNTVEQRSALALFVAFQMIRTRWQRDQFVNVEKQLAAHLARTGDKVENLRGYQPLTQDRLVAQHIEFIRSGLPRFAQAFGNKHFLLLQAPEGRSFYLSDNPVAMHNDGPAHPHYGNIGLEVKGIQIYLPLSSDLMLAAFCPTIAEEIQAGLQGVRKKAQEGAVHAILHGDMSIEQIKCSLREVEKQLAVGRSYLESVKSGEPILAETGNMDFCNSLQMIYARDFVVCAKGDFKLARAMMRTNPKLQTGFTMG